MREPGTILARPSALAGSRLAWVILTSVLAVMLPPTVARWSPWWAAPLVVSALVDAGFTAAVAWGLAGVVAVAVLPPGGNSIPVEALATVLSVLALRRVERLFLVTPWAPALFGALALAVHDGTLVLADAARSGSARIDLASFAGRLLATAVLSAALVSPWLAWARRERERGRA